jgi:D-serine deaminase-like pyridoxal phosphate-dependent protein
MSLPPFSDIETPAAVVDMERVRRNLEAVAAYTRDHGLGWRPHVKTHKSPVLARMQIEAGAVGLTVATPREAEVMAPVCDDLLLAHPPVGPKVDRILQLPTHVRLTVALDDPSLLAPLAEAARAHGRTVGILVEIDVGMGRVGIPDPDATLRMVEAVLAEGAVSGAGSGSGVDSVAGGLDWRGILFYPGHIRVPEAEQPPLLAAVGDRLALHLERLAAAGHHPEVVSGGSTPTLFQSHLIPGLTEIRPGTSIFHDRDSVAVGAARHEDVAYTVLATVVSTAVPGQAVVDAGSKALARENFRGGSEGDGFGILLDRPDVVVRRVSEEHGILDLSGTDWRPQVGEHVRIVPNHVCVSVNLQDQLMGVEFTTDGAAERTALDLPGRGRGRVGLTTGAS